MGLFSSIGELLGFENPANGAMPYLEQSDKLAQPYHQSGLDALKSNQDLYHNQISNPGQELGRIGQGYEQSPGYQYALQQALGSVNAKAGSEGLLGSPTQDKWRMETASGLASQDYNKWLEHVLGLYGMGTQGMGHIQDQGYDATQSLMNNMSSKANLAYNGQNQENAFTGGLLGAFANGLSGGFGG